MRVCLRVFMRVYTRKLFILLSPFQGIRFEKDLTVSPWKDIRGYIMLYDVNSPNKGAVPLTIEGNLNLDEFNPHGISIWREKGRVCPCVFRSLHPGASWNALHYITLTVRMSPYIAQFSSATDGSPLP